MYSKFLESIENFRYAFLSNALFHYLFIIGLILLTQLLLVNRHTKPIATVNVTQIVNHFIKEETKFQNSKEVLQMRVKTFGKQLEMAMKEISKSEGIILVPTEAVITGAEDKTDIVQKRLQLKRENN